MACVSKGKRHGCIRNQTQKKFCGLCFGYFVQVCDCLFLSSKEENRDQTCPSNPYLQTFRS